jgi:uncharacterized membrane protein
MESKIKLFGHPVHPMLIVYPIAAFSLAVLFDILFLIFGGAALPTVSFYIIAAGVVGGLLAAIFGFMDWLALPNDSRAKRIGGWHGLGNFVIVVLFAVSWLIRRADVNLVPNGTALLLSFVGVGMALVTAWIGGELVYRLGVGVDRGANVDAPSSLSQPTITNTERLPRR